MNALEIENDETENCEALTVNLISSAKGKTSEHQRGNRSCGSQNRGERCGRESSHARRRLCHQPPFSKSYFEISCFLLLEILKVPPGLSL